MGDSSNIKDVIQSWLNSVMEIIEGFTLLHVGWSIKTLFLAKRALATVVLDVGLN